MACCIKSSRLSICFSFITERIILLPAPIILIFDNPSLRLCEGNIKPNILEMKSFSTLALFCCLITLNPQKVKNILTFLPAANMPLAITKVANALSRSSLNTINVFVSLPFIELPCVGIERFFDSVFFTVALITPPDWFISISFAPTILHHAFRSCPKA